MSIPVFIYHEGAQSYVRDCIEQASKYHKRVILFGNKNNYDMCREWQDVSRFSSPLWEEFRKYYKHMTSNGSKFDISSFKRFFVYENFMERNEIGECICLDSDVLVYTDLSKAVVTKKCNAAFHVPGNVMAWTLENIPAWAGCAYWRKAVLRDFLLYCIDIYKNHQDRLNDAWKIFRKKHLPGGICDMILVTWWYLEKGTENVWIWTKYSKRGVADLNFSAPDNYLENEYRMDCFGIGKRVIVKKGQPYFISKAHGSVRVLMIHFQGDKKIYMNYFRRHGKIAFWLPYIDKISEKFHGKNR